MDTNRLLCLLILVVSLMSTACSPQVTLTPAAAASQDEPITLHLAVSDQGGRPSEPYVLEFIEQVKMLSNGSLTIEPLWEAGAITEAGFEVGVVQLVREGQADLGLSGSRAFDMEGITSFQALQAPFLITSDALSKAVATSDITARMLDSLSSSGVVGLTLWPEDLRHPFSTIPDKPILSPDDLKGSTVRVVPSQVTHMLIETLGGSPIFGDGYQAAESGLRQGTSLTGTPTATGNVTFFAKYQVLFANGDAFQKLSEVQRAVLHEAAAAVQQKAIAEHPSELDAATAWCADGGTVVIASEEQVAAFEAAAQPVFDQIEQDPLGAELIAAIRELKAKTAPAQAAEACAPEAVQTSPDSDSATGIWLHDVLPNGIWQVQLTEEDIVRMGVLRSTAAQMAGIYTWRFQDGHAQFDLQGTSGTNQVSCLAEYSVVGEIVRLDYVGSATCDGDAFDDVQWRLDTDGLHFHLVAPQSVELKATYETKPWQKVEEWSHGLPPNGVWQVELTVEDFVRMGVLRSVAEAEWAGTYTLTLKDGKSVGVWKGLQGQTGKCQANYEVIGDVVRFTYYQTTGGECEGQVDDLQWRLDDEGLHFHVVDIKHAPLIEIKAYLEAKPWQKVGDS